MRTATPTHQTYSKTTAKALIASLARPQAPVKTFVIELPSGMALTCKSVKGGR